MVAKDRGLRTEERTSPMQPSVLMAQSYLVTSEKDMAKKGFKLLDSDMHIVEPPDLWERYIDPAFRAQAPRGWSGPENPSVLEVAGKVMPRFAATPQAHYQTMYARKGDRYRHAIARHFDPHSQLEAMDVEGIDVAVLFPTRGLYALATDDLEPELAAAIARAYNDWLADFCAVDPSRLIGPAMVAPHHIEASVVEGRRLAILSGSVSSRSIAMRNRRTIPSTGWGQRIASFPPTTTMPTQTTARPQ